MCKTTWQDAHKTISKHHPHEQYRQLLFASLSYPSVRNVRLILGCFYKVEFYVLVICYRLHPPMMLRPHEHPQTPEKPSHRCCLHPSDPWSLVAPSMEQHQNPNVQTRELLSLAQSKSCHPGLFTQKKSHTDSYCWWFRNPANHMGCIKHYKNPVPTTPEDERGTQSWRCLKIIFLSKWVICRFHVNLPGCINWCRISSINSRTKYVDVGDFFAYLQGSWATFSQVSGFAGIMKHCLIILMQRNQLHIPSIHINIYIYINVKINVYISICKYTYIYIQKI